MLEVQNLSISIAKHTPAWLPIVKDISFNVDSGEVLALIGESGSGKTMTGLGLLRLLPRLAAYGAHSKIILHGADLLQLQEREMQKVRGADIAMIFQEPMTSLNPIYTTGQQILEVLRIHRGMRGRYANLEAMRLLEAVRIVNPIRCFHSYPHQLSGGMQQRVMIAIALACKPNILIADEPTTALDVTTQAKILELLYDLQRAENMAMILITHDLGIAAEIANKVAVMQAGTIVEQNSVQEFFIAPQNAYSLKLLGSLPSHLHLKARTMEQTVPILTVRDLQVYFPIKKGLLQRTIDHVRAVEDANFNVYKGQTLAIVGESGSGKSTLAKAILGLNMYARGEVVYNNVNLLNLEQLAWRPYRADIQIIFQDPYSALDPKLPIYETIMEGMRLHSNASNDQMHAKIDKLLIQVGLQTEYKWRYPHEFSGGERQRICIARALSVDPKIIICDEPTSSLDVSVQAQILSLLLNLQNEHELTYIFITHDLNIVRVIAQNVIVMQGGTIVEAGETSSIFQHPKHAYTKELLASSIKESQIY